VLREDLQVRAAALSSRPLLSIFCSLKPLDKRCFPSYLRRHGLGQWVKLRLRSASLQLLSFLGSHTRPPLSPAHLSCRLCGVGLEDVNHFICICPSLSTERESFISALRNDAPLSLLPGFSPLFDLLSLWAPLSCVPLLLESVEDPCDKRPRNSSQRAVLISALEPHVLRFLSSIWLRRAGLLGRIPSIDVHGDRLSTTVLLHDGRCRSFAVGLPP